MDQEPDNGHEDRETDEENPPGHTSTRPLDTTDARAPPNNSARIDHAGLIEASSAASGSVFDEWGLPVIDTKPRSKQKEAKTNTGRTTGEDLGFRDLGLPAVDAKARPAAIAHHHDDDGKLSQEGAAPHHVPPLPVFHLNHNLPRRPGAYRIRDRRRHSESERWDDHDDDDDVDPDENDEASAVVNLEAFVVTEDCGAPRTAATPPQREAPLVEGKAEKGRGRGCSRGLWICAVAMAVVVAVAAPIVWTLRRDTGAPASDPATAPPPPSAAPPLDPWEVLGPFIEHPSDPDDPATLAFHWIVDGDPSGLANASGTEAWRLSQRFALALLYHSTNGTNWTHGLGFLTAPNECDWNEVLPFVEFPDDVFIDGVNNTQITAGIPRCSRDGRVTSIRLLENGLAGTVPWDALAELLPGLESVDLSLNPGLVGGTLPAELGRATNMRSLSLRGCGLVGTLPEEWSAWTDLQSITLVNNTVTGTLPASYRAWTSLVALQLAVNDLTGSLPSELAELGAALRVVSLGGGNGFEGTLPREWANWTGIENFSVGSPGLQGMLPKDYAAWTSLRLVKFLEGALTGTLPEEYRAWTNLEQAAFINHPLTGTLPEAYTAWTNLQRSFFVGAELSGTLPEIYGTAWTNLEEVGFFQNQRLTGTLPESYGAWTNLWQAYFYRNALTGTLPAAYGAWTNLAEAGFSTNRLEGTLPEEYRSWTKLRLLQMHRNRLSGTLPSSYESWTSLRDLNLSRNRLSGGLPLGYGAWSRVERILLFENELEGEFPAALLEDWSVLGDYDFTDTGLSGTDLLLLPYYREGYDLSCNICGDGNRITLPRGDVDLSRLGYATEPCRVVQDSVSVLPPAACPIVVEAATLPCGCTQSDE